MLDEPIKASLSVSVHEDSDIWFRVYSVGTSMTAHDLGLELQR